MNQVDYWNKKHHKYLSEDWIHKPSRFAEWVRQYLPTSGTLIDLGAGQGQDSEYFRALGFEVTATDFASEAIELGRKTYPKVNFELVDLSHPLPYADASFDVVYASLSLHYFDSAKTRDIFAEIARSAWWSG